MIVSWNWLKEYVRLDMPVGALTDRLMMAGLNLEEVADVEGDIAIDLEVTSNRPDCLCHVGIAREVGALFDREWKLPAAEPPERGPAAASLTSVEIRCPDLCPQYSARVILGVKVGPSPSWMQRRLTTLGIRPINNVVDITNYVLMECSQPLHAFDFDKLDGKKIVVRRGEKGEKITAIDQRPYEVTPEMCVIADASRPVAIAGVMGGLDTEIGTRTTNVLIEVAEFTPLSVRNTARKLHLHSDSSYRFERGIDRHNLDWASRRCAQLILELAGGELCRGAVFDGQAPATDRTPIVLRLSQIPRILGIDIPQPEVERILRSLGLEALPPLGRGGRGGRAADSAAANDQADAPSPVRRGSPDPAAPPTAGLPARETTLPAEETFGQPGVAGSGDRPQPEGDRPQPKAPALHYVPPHWRRDLTREIDLIEEVARVYGYEKIPENVTVPLEVSRMTPADRLAHRLSDALIAAGFFEAVTLSFVGDELLGLFRPWTDAPPLRVEHTSRQRENILRQSLVPSLLQARRQNERHGNFNAQLFEMARAYLAPDPDRPQAQPRLLGIVSGRSFAEMKGIVELLVDATSHAATVTARLADLPSCLPGRACELLVGDKRLGWLGEISDDVRSQLDLHDPVTAAELDLGVLESLADFAPAYKPLPEFPAIERDLNFVLDEAVTWQELESVVRTAAGPLLESVAFESQYRGQQIAADKKSYVARLHYRALDRTLTAEEVDAAQKKVVTACQEKLTAALR